MSSGRSGSGRRRGSSASRPSRPGRSKSKGGRRSRRRHDASRARRFVRPALGLIVLAVAVVAGSLGASRLGAAVAEMELFRVTTVEVEGIEYLDREAVLALAAIDTEASVWDDPAPLIERLEYHPLVVRVGVRKRLPHTLVLEVTESEPVALVPTPTLRPVDRQGRILPLDPAEQRLDLPLLRVSLDPEHPDFTSSVALATLIEEAVRLRDINPELAARVSTIGLDASGSVVIELFSPEVTVRYRAPSTEEWLAMGVRALADARSRRGAQPRMLDLRFPDQVVVGFDDAPSHGWTR